MGYEICYKYYEKIDGEYKKDDLKVFKRKIGDPFEDTPLEKVSTSIIAQFARRDIWIADVEVFELTKKKIAFKETKGGIVLKNKKFLFDSIQGTFEVEVLEEECEKETEAKKSVPETTLVPCNVNLCSPSKNIPSTNVNLCATNNANTTNNTKRRVVDNLVFSPEPQQLIEAKRKNLKLTVDKKYEVYQKKPSPNGLGDLCLIIDDSGKEQFVTDLYFIPASINLFGDKELGFSESQKENDNLLWGNASTQSGVPKLRR
jgi:hypothetical protein